MFVYLRRRMKRPYRNEASKISHVLSKRTIEIESLDLLTAFGSGRTSLSKR